LKSLGWTMSNDEQDTIDVEIPPNEPMPPDIGMQPEAASDTHALDYREPMMGPNEFFEDISVGMGSGGGEQISLRLTTAQMRRWVDIFGNWVNEREQALDADLGEAWGMYIVTVEEYAPRTAPGERDDTDPIT